MPITQSTSLPPPPPPARVPNVLHLAVSHRVQLYMCACVEEREEGETLFSLPGKRGHEAGTPYPLPLATRALKAS